MSSPHAVLLHGRFSEKLRTYLFAYGALMIAATVVGIPLLLLWFVVGSIWVNRYYASLRCDLTEKTVVIAKGVVFRRELTVPLDKIQDISVREGPLLSALGLLQLRIETAGQHNAATGKPDALLVGLEDARLFRDRILQQRNRLLKTTDVSGASRTDVQLLTEIRDTLLRIESGSLDDRLRA